MNAMARSYLYKIVHLYCLYDDLTHAAYAIIKQRSYCLLLLLVCWVL